MEEFASATKYGLDSPERDQAMARHHALRQGQAFVDELARVKAQCHQ
jgi:hypothetical protein